jgi:uncharacterized protein YkwD
MRGFYVEEGEKRMKGAWFFTSFVLLALLATACSRNPDNLTPARPTTTAVDSLPVQPSSTPTTQAQVDTPATPQPSAVLPTLTVELSEPAPTIPATQGAEPPPSIPTSTSPGAPCLDEAVFVGDITVPDGTLFRPGEAFTKTWRVKNTGTCTWDTGYSLVYISGDIMNGNFNNPIGPTSPGELADVSVDMAAPMRGGEQTGYWQFKNASGQPFGVGFNRGGPLWVKINVTFFDPDPQPTAVVIMPPPQFGPTPTLGVSAGPTPTRSVSAGPTPTRSVSVGLAPTPTSRSVPTPTPAFVVVNPTAPPASIGCTPQQNTVYVDQMLTLINQARAESGLQPVFLQSQLSQAALKHSIDMACNRFVDHHGSNGSTWYDRVQAEGYANPRSSRENIKVGTNVQETFDWWMDSQIHRDNILFPNVTEVGIGYVFVPGSPFGSYFTLLLSRR